MGYLWANRLFLYPSFYQALPDPTPSVGAKIPYALAFFYHDKIADISEYFYRFRDTIVIVYNTDTIFKGDRL